MKTDIYECAVTATDYEHLDKIAQTIDPKAAQDASALAEARVKFTAKLEPSLVDEFRRLEEHKHNEAYWHELASFYLGCAVAAQLGGKTVRR